MYEVEKSANTKFRRFLKEVIHINGISAMKSIARYKPQVSICVFIYSSLPVFSQNVLM